MIRGVHTMFYSSQPDAVRAFLRDKLGFDCTDTGGGGLIFPSLGPLFWVSCLLSLLVYVPSATAQTDSNSIVDIGSRLELFVDPFMVDELKNATRVMHQPHREDPAFFFDKPWEGRFSAYVTVILDDSLFRAYYRGHPVAGKDGSLGEVTAYAESTDGIRWEKPNLELFEVDGSRNNNAVLADASPFSHNFSPFIDERPGVPDSLRYKAVAGTEKSGLFGFVSADGTTWRKLQDEPILTDGMFDSQNVAFWSQHEKKYVCYFRTWTEGGYKGFRTISRATSDDFIHWSQPIEMTYGDTPQEHLYTSATTPYFRAPHIYISLPNRFFPDKAVFDSTKAQSMVNNPTYGVSSSDAVLMSSRGGTTYDRSFMEAFIPPGPTDEDWVSRNNMPAWGIVPGNEREMFIYRLGHYTQPSNHLIRYTLRTDGFASIRAPYSGGEMITRPLSFSGGALQVNFASSAAGGVKVEIQDEGGNPIPGFELENSVELVGDQISQEVGWSGSPDLSKLSGTPVRLRFVMVDSDLFSFRFRSDAHQD